VGTGFRYGIGLLATRIIGTALPWGTFLANLVGCLLMGAVMEAFGAGTLKGETLRLALTTGFLGGFTTYSAFNLETTRLFTQSPIVGIGYFGATATGCILMGLLGALATRHLIL